MFAFDGSEERLLEVKNVLSDYFRKKADVCLDALWDSGKLNQVKLDELRQQDLHDLLKKQQNMERIVLDTNCLIQSIPSRSKYRKIWDSFFDGTNILCVTTSILNEYEEILQLLTNEETAKYIINAIVSSPYTQFVNVYFAFNLIEKDPDDNKFVDCAITAGARFIVTEDHHCDVIKWKEFPGIDIVGLDDFLQHINSL